MEKLLIAAGIVFFLSASVMGQDVENRIPSTEQVKKLSFLVGNWEGQGWMMGRDGMKHEFNQTESVELRLSDTAMLIEGQGRSNGQTIHNALAVIRGGQSAGEYIFDSYLVSGESAQFDAELKEDTLYWYPNENTRYIITLNENGQWFERGEINRNGDWFQFFEMTLDKSGQ